ncbi:hypothetical protein CW368_06055 [Actinomycetales bacterium SN12]|nr:hypothetical protein CW368_06055 [Actinomycetales bacterium SN12]
MTHRSAGSSPRRSPPRSWRPRPARRPARPPGQSACRVHRVARRAAECRRGTPRCRPRRRSRGRRPAAAARCRR